jgi:hypothetical protein
MTGAWSHPTTDAVSPPPVPALPCDILAAPNPPTEDLAAIPPPPPVTLVRAWTPPPVIDVRGWPPLPLAMEPPKSSDIDVVFAFRRAG